MENKAENMRERIAQIVLAVKPTANEFLHENYLVTNGILDSLDLLNLIDKLESELNIIIDPEDVLAENVESIQTMVNFVGRKVEET